MYAQGKQRPCGHCYPAITKKTVRFEGSCFFCGFLVFCSSLLAIIRPYSRIHCCCIHYRCGFRRSVEDRGRSRQTSATGRDGSHPPKQLDEIISPVKSIRFPRRGSRRTASSNLDLDTTASSKLEQQGVAFPVLQRSTGKGRQQHRRGRRSQPSASASPVEAPTNHSSGDLLAEM